LTEDDKRKKLGAGKEERRLFPGEGVRYTSPRPLGSVKGTWARKEKRKNEKSFHSLPIRER